MIDDHDRDGGSGGSIVGGENEKDEISWLGN